MKINVHLKKQQIFKRRHMSWPFPDCDSERSSNYRGHAGSTDFQRKQRFTASDLFLSEKVETEAEGTLTFALLLRSKANQGHRPALPDGCIKLASQTPCLKTREASWPFRPPVFHPAVASHAHYRLLSMMGTRLFL